MKTYKNLPNRKHLLCTSAPTSPSTVGPDRRPPCARPPLANPNLNPNPNPKWAGPKAGGGRDPKRIGLN